MKINTPTQIVSRRNVLEWLGKGYVIALSGSALAGCVTESPSATVTGISFRAGGETHPVYKEWYERTVDRQDVIKILATWKLTVNGLVETPRVYNFAEMITLKRADMVADFHCVEGWSVLDVPWNGVHLSTIFEQVKPLKTANYAAFHTIGGKYNGSVPMKVALEPKTLMAYGVAGSTLPLSHGFPLRAVVPRMYGYKSAKYVERIELTDKLLNEYWVKGGYPYNGEIPLSDLRPGKF